MAVDRVHQRDAGKVAHFALALLYAFVLLGSAFLHHDFDCHEKSRTHCTSCIYSQAVTGVAAETSAPRPPTLEITNVDRHAVRLTSTTPVAFAADRAPPPLLIG
jgi:hypothetical protein